ncbi:MAG: site-specific integrase [Gemmataceae bacterium]
MADNLPIHKYIKVRFRRRRNKIKGPGEEPTTSYTLYWREFGKKRFLSLGQFATRAFTERMAAEKEKELNSPMRRQAIRPASWADFVKAYLNETYPGHELPPKDRKAKSASWKKSLGTMKREKLAFGHFERICKPGWCHEITAADRDHYITYRLGEVGSASTVDAELRVLHTLCELMAEREHRSKSDNPFAGKARVDDRRRRHKARGKEAKAKHYTLEEIRTLLALADREATTWEGRRFRALVYFVAYTGCRLNEALHLEWQDVDFARGVAWLCYKVENDLKTAGSEAPFGLPDRLLDVIREWEKEKTCAWVFPNSRKKPWKGGAPGYRPFDQMQALGERAGVTAANFKKFRHSLTTHGKQHFGMTAEQVRAQLRHTTTETQKHYTHDDLTNLRNAMRAVDFER